MSGKRSRAFRAYQKIKTLRPARSLFDLSHDVLMTADMFKLYPVCAMEMSPGDTFHIWNQSVTRMQPLNAPILSEITQSTHYFFVPYRILDENWVEFITGGTEGESGGISRSDTDEDRDGYLDPVDATPELPRWIPTKKDVGSLWDYFGLPTGVDPKGSYPIDYLRRAYNRIWNEYYRDENLQDEVSEDNEDILTRSWKKDYFTSALLSQQRGVSPTMPVSGNLNVLQSPNEVVSTQTSYQSYMGSTVEFTAQLPAGLNMNLIHITPNIGEVRITTSSSTTQLVKSNLDSWTYNSETGVASAIYSFVNPGVVPVSVVASYNPIFIYSVINGDFASSGAGFDVKDLRQAFQIQKWLELANRGGVRYTEFLRAFFGVSPRDDRLQRPEYIGGSKSPVVISEVLQTNASVADSTPLAYMAGHGLGAERTYIGSYSASEYGILIGLMSYTTPPVYTQGINRQWLRRTKYDFLFPQFTGLSEQAIEGAEIYATDSEIENRKVWGFNEVYDELRAMTSKVVGKMRTVFKYWHLARFFESKPALNADFIDGKDVSKRIFAVQSEDGFIVHYANIIRAVRPLPKYGTPKGV